MSAGSYVFGEHLQLNSKRLSGTHVAGSTPPPLLVTAAVIRDSAQGLVACVALAESYNQS